MASISPLAYQLHLNCPVKWTATQEKSIGREYPFDISPNETPETFVSRTYLQFLWLPESIMPLRCLIPSLLRVHPPIPTSTISAPSSSTARSQSLNALLTSLLLTPRTSSQKYHARIPQLLIDEDAPPNPETNMLWFVSKYEKTEFDDQENEQDQEAAEETWKISWLDRIERREVMIQILLHFLIMSLPCAHAAPEAFQSDLSSKFPRKQKRKATESDVELSVTSVEERLESFMDKLSMWQLTSALDKVASGLNTSKQLLPDTKGKGRVLDERDWMQVFCEDVVEHLFKANLPQQCALLRTKVFPDSPFSEGSDTDLASSPPTSPRQRQKRLKTSSASSSRRQSPYPEAHDLTPKDRQLSRSRSLSVSLEEERERSRSLSVGPGNMRKRVLAREVSMTTVFKEKTKFKDKERKEKTRLRSSSKVVGKEAGSVLKAAEKTRGKTLVASTPVKKDKIQSQARLSSAAGLLPLEKPNFHQSGPVEGGPDDDEWTLPSSPDILLLGSNDEWDEVGEESGEDGQLSNGNHVLVNATPTKRPLGNSR